MQVMPFVLRRTKAQVLQDLPPKIIQDIYCDMSPLQVERVVGRWRRRHGFFPTRFGVP